MYEAENPIPATRPAIIPAELARFQKIPSDGREERRRGQADERHHLAAEPRRVHAEVPGHDDAAGDSDPTGPHPRGVGPQPAVVEVVTDRRADDEQQAGGGRESGRTLATLRMGTVAGLLATDPGPLTQDRAVEHGVQLCIGFISRDAPSAQTEGGQGTIDWLRRRLVNLADHRGRAGRNQPGKSVDNRLDVLGIAGRGRRPGQQDGGPTEKLAARPPQELDDQSNRTAGQFPAI